MTYAQIVRKYREMLVYCQIWLKEKREIYRLHQHDRLIHKFTTSQPEKGLKAKFKYFSTGCKFGLERAKIISQIRIYEHTRRTGTYKNLVR